MELDRRFLQVEDPFIAEDLRQMELATNYNNWLYSLIQPFLGRRILEIGPGIGNLTHRFIADAEYVEGIEPNATCADILMETFEGNPKFCLERAKVEDSDFEALALKNFDTIVCINVLEHIKDDDEALQHFYRILVRGGNLVLLVPAMPWAYGPIDAAVGHFRRYTLGPLKSKLQKAGFSIASSRYSNLLGLIGWTFNAKIKRSIKQSDQQIRIFDALVPVIRRVEGTIRPPVGLSIIMTGRKSE